MDDENSIMPAATLANLLKHNNGFRLSCNQCGRTAMMNIPKLIENYGETMVLLEIAKRSRCKECGDKGAYITVVAGEAEKVSKYT